MASVPPALLLTCLVLYSVNVPFWDEWEVWSTFLAGIKAHGFQPAMLLSQQNEHRNMIARVIGFLLMPAAHLNRYPEYAILFVLCAGCYALLLGMARRTLRELDLAPDARISILFSALVFSTVQWEVFAYGINTSIVFTVFCLLSGAALLQRGRLEVWRLLLVVAAGWAGSFNFANGLFYWICLLPLLLAIRADKDRKAMAVAVFVGSGALAWLAYFHGYVHPDNHPPLTAALAHPVSLAAFFITYLSGSLVADQNLAPAAFVLGCGACVFFALLLRELRRQAPESLPALLPWLCLALFSVLSGGGTAVGRSAYGVSYALQSRYAPFSNLYWCALLILTVAAAGRLRSSGGLMRRVRYFLVAALALLVLGDILGAVVFHDRHGRLEAAHRALFSLTSDEPLKELHASPNYVRHCVPLFFDMRLSVYDGIKRLDQYSEIATAPGEAGSVDSVMVEVPGGDLPSGLRLGGRAVDPRTGEPALYVCFVSGGRIIFAAKPDASGRFDVLLMSDCFEGQETRIVPLAVLSDGVSVARLPMPMGGVVALPDAWQPPYVLCQHKTD